MPDLPQIEINIACEGWLAENTLLKLVEEAVGAVTQCARLEYPANAELSLLFSDDTAICTLNKNFRNINKPTNVLSFPGDSILPGDKASQMLGDIAFALQTIDREATVEKRKFEHHLSHLMIHGFLHLFGYDHQTDEEAETMETLEKDALARLGIANPYEDDLFQNAQGRR